MTTSRKLLDNVADTTASAFGIGEQGATVWVSAGTADLKLDGDTIAALVVGTPKVISKEVSPLTVVATSAGTTVSISQ
jgi:hypothetical protein